MRRRRIAVVTGSRAEYGLLHWVLHDLQAHPEVELQLIVTGMHLAPEFGMTVREIERDGIPIARKVEMLLSSDTPGGVLKSMALGIIGLSDAIEQLRSDIMLVLGDRFEILAAAQVALIHNVALVHIAGGDITEGAFDESIRHAVTKMSQLHLVTSELSARRVIQMGEDPARVHVVGSPGLDQLHRTPLLARAQLEHELGACLGKHNYLITFHPVTLESGESVRQQEELLATLSDCDPSTHLWFTRPNADTGGRALALALEQWAQGRPNVHVFTSLGQQRYLSLMALADVVLGNSSSGLYEAPSLKVPTVNVGDRQLGREAASSVFHCDAERSAIRRCLELALAFDCSGVVNPYGDGHSTGRIIEALLCFPIGPQFLKKRFHLIGA